MFVILLRASNNWQMMKKLSKMARTMSSRLNMLDIFLEQRTGIAMLFEAIPTTPMMVCITFSVQYENTMYISSEELLHSVLLPVELVTLFVVFIFGMSLKR